MNQVQTDVSRDSCIYRAVVESIAKAEGTHPTELTPPLNEVINPDGLKNLITDNQTLGKVVFNYKGYSVSVFTDRYVSVESQGI